MTKKDRDTSDDLVSVFNMINNLSAECYLPIMSLR